MDDLLLKTILAFAKKQEKESNSYYIADVYKDVNKNLYNKMIGSAYIENVKPVYDGEDGTLTLYLDLFIFKDFANLSHTLKMIREIVKSIVYKYNFKKTVVVFNNKRCLNVMTPGEQTFIKMKDFEILLQYLCTDRIRCKIDTELGQLSYSFSNENKFYTNKAINDVIEKYFYNNYGLNLNADNVWLAKAPDDYVVFETISEKDCYNTFFSQMVI